MMDPSEISDHPRPGANFPATRWTVVISAKEGGAEEAARAMESLARAYWQPIFAFLRGKGLAHQDAQDAAQGFFAYLLERNFLGNVQPQGGRFRNFLLVCLRRWVRDEEERVVNVKRRQEVPFQEWNVAGEAFPASGARPPEEAFDRAWAMALVARAMARLEEKWRHREALFAALRLTVECPGNTEKYASIAARLGMNEGAVGKAAHDLRKHFAEEVRSEIRHTVARDEDVEDELRYLVRLIHP